VHAARRQSVGQAGRRAGIEPLHRRAQPPRPLRGVLRIGRLVEARPVPRLDLRVPVGWKGNVDADRLLTDNAESRRISSGPAPDL
jgi:hypothetical protein